MAETQAILTETGDFILNLGSWLKGRFIMLMKEREKNISPGSGKVKWEKDEKQNKERKYIYDRSS